MSLSSINTNIAAYSAQRNIGAASDSAGSSIARLSSGNRIVKASDDVAALSTGTSLRTSVTTLKQALLNTSQGSSLLQIADGALGQVVDILQRQKALAVQSGSGSLSNTDRSFLNQEFQALTDEINRIATQTKFSSVTLLNGNLSGAQGITSNTTAGVATNNQTAANVFAFTGAPANNSTIIVNGVTVTFTTSAVGSADAAGKVVVGAAVAQSAANLAKFLNESTDARLSNVQFIANGANITASWAGGQLQGAYVLDASLGTAGNITLGTAPNRTIAVGTTADGLSVNNTKAIGPVTGSILTSGATAAAGAGPALTTYFTGANQGVQNNAAFIGKIGQGSIGNITASFSAASTAVFSLRVGDITYSSVATNVVNAAAVNVLMQGRDSLGANAGGTFSFNIAGGAIIAADAADQNDFNILATQLNEALSGVTFTQNRDVTSFQEGAIVSLGGAQIANLNGASVNFRSGNFTAVNIEDIQIDAPAIGTTDAKITARINGETYTSFSGIGNQIQTNVPVTLQNVSDPTKSLTIMTGNVAIAGSTAALDLSTQAKADAVKDALKTAFGIQAGSAAVKFQVGNNSSESLGVRIDSVETKNIFSGATLSVDTQANASAAGTAIDAALNRVTAIRAGVGALQSRFDFAGSVLEVNIQNQDAARGVLLDTDVTAESTAYATAQVQLQAGIAVLAQANLLPQNLLKLIG
ncbi:MAG: flagellin [Rickettsiales bacterium]